MHTFSLTIPSYELSIPCESHDFGTVIEVAREHARRFDAAVYIVMLNAAVGCPNRWAVSPKGYLSVEDVQLPRCVGCGDY